MNHTLARLLPVAPIEDLPGSIDIQPIPCAEIIDFKISPPPVHVFISKNSAIEAFVRLSLNLLIYPFRHFLKAPLPAGFSLSFDLLLQEIVGLEPGKQRFVRINAPPA